VSSSAVVNAATTIIQALALLAVLAGVALLLPLGWALVVDGALVLVAATAAEVADRRARRAPSDSRPRAKVRSVA
jgi:hypothetical protein